MIPPFFQVPNTSKEGGEIIKTMGGVLNKKLQPAEVSLDFRALLHSDCFAEHR
jgi:hypothetical protein